MSAPQLSSETVHLSPDSLTLCLPLQIAVCSMNPRPTVEEEDELPVARGAPPLVNSTHILLPVNQVHSDMPITSLTTPHNPQPLFLPHSPREDTLPLPPLSEKDLGKRRQDGHDAVLDSMTTPEVYPVSSSGRPLTTEKVLGERWQRDGDDDSVHLSSRTRPLHSPLASSSTAAVSSSHPSGQHDLATFFSGYGTIVTPPLLLHIPLRLHDAPSAEPGDGINYLTTFSLNRDYMCLKISGFSQVDEIAMNNKLELSGRRNVLVFKKLECSRTVQRQEHSEILVTYQNEPCDDVAGSVSTYTLNRRYEFTAVGPRHEMLGVYSASAGHIICTSSNTPSFI
ncbi:hypothetical protein K438DRAFT_1784139 [Mycena galopus ATCC 62051]|nr:hypothetical protein K438DRAFT_1784139 [Mycena galopus ATCC 62051]